MPYLYKRKVSYQKKNTKRRAVRRYPKVRRALASRNIYKFQRTVHLGNLDINNTIAIKGSMVWKLTDLPDYAEFVSLFDQYRITGVLIKLVPTFTGGDLNPVASQFVLPTVHSVIDHTESGTPADENEMMQYTSYKNTRGHLTHKRFVKPNVLGMKFETVSTTAYTPQWKQWLTTDDPATPHYGLKYIIDPTNSATSVRYRIYCKYYLETKNVK